MPYNTSTGVYTASSGAETATAGQTLASNTWDQINVDYRTALTQLGPTTVPFFRGGQPSGYLAVATAVNFAASASDVASFTIPLPVSVSNYTVAAMRIGNAGGNMNGVTVSLFTGANATGLTIISSTSITISTSLPSNSNSYQVIIPTSANLVLLNAPTLFLHITASTATSSTASVGLQIIPAY